MYDETTALVTSMEANQIFHGRNLPTLLVIMASREAPTAGRQSRMTVCHQLRVEGLEHRSRIQSSDWPQTETM